MTRRFTSEKQIRSRAWHLHAEFDVAGHPLLADIQTDKLFPEYVRECFDVPASYLNQLMKGLVLLSFSIPTAVSSLCNRGVVPVVGILHDSRVVCESTVQQVASPGKTTTRVFYEIILKRFIL
jgi:hypothetical protein